MGHGLRLVGPQSASGARGPATGEHPRRQLLEWSPRSNWRRRRSISTTTTTTTTCTRARTRYECECDREYSRQTRPPPPRPSVLPHCLLPIAFA